MKIQSIVCPNCGATTKNKDSCEFCGSFLVGKIAKGIDVSKYADTVRNTPIDNGIKRMLETFTSMINEIGEKYGKLLSLRIIDVVNHNNTILIVKSSKKNIQLMYPHERFGAFANCSMFSFFQKDTASLGMDIDGSVKFISQFINELYPNADTSYVIYASNPYYNEEDNISDDEEEDNREYLVEARYNRDGDFVKGVFCEKWDEDKFDENPDEYDNEIGISSADFNSHSIKTFVEKETKELGKNANDKLKKTNSQKELITKLEAKLCDENFIRCVIGLGGFYIDSSIWISFECYKSSIHLKFFYSGFGRIEFGRFGDIRPCPYRSSSDKRPHSVDGFDWLIEQRYILEATDLKKIAESNDKDKSTLYIEDKRGNLNEIYSKRLRVYLTTIWHVVESPSDEIYKLQIINDENEEYIRNKKKLDSRKTWLTIVLVLGGILSGVWSLLLGKLFPLICFAVIIIPLGILCSIKVNELKSKIKAYESKYGDYYRILKK